jgi:drug/metabolite transporter (DMT)-like permease
MEVSMRGWLSVLSWYTVIVGALAILSGPFMIGKAISYEPGGIALISVFSMPTIALGVLVLILRDRLTDYR